MIPIKIDQISKGLDRSIYDLKKEDFEKILRVLLKQVQDIEDTNFQILNERSIFTAIGAQLDVIGILLVVPREGLDDEPYRKKLLLKLATNSADGTPNSIIDIIKTYSESASVEIREGVIAFGNIVITGGNTLDSGLWSLVQDIKPVGTLWNIHTDYHNNAFRPAYENGNNIEEAFQTSNDGVNFDNFQTSNDGVDFETFFTKTGTKTYANNTDKNAVPYFEGLSPFQTSNDGVNFENFIVDGEAFEVLDESAGVPKNIIPLTWEVYENSKSPVELKSFYVNNGEGFVPFEVLRKNPLTGELSQLQLYLK